MLSCKLGSEFRRQRTITCLLDASFMNSDLSNESRDAGGELRLLPEQALLTTGAVDHASWNYRLILGRIQRLRFDLVRSMLRGSRARRLLEIGYGSGVFLPELARHADQLHGIDPHPFPDDVAQVLAQHGVQAELVRGTATQMPYESGFFQTVVAVSALEFIEDLTQACREIKRVLAPGGIFVLVTPGHSPLLDLGLRLVTGASPRDDFQARRPQILPGLYREFVVDRRADYPPFAHGIRLYTALRLSVPATIAKSTFSSL
jgi:SAM-dependent methyltransferase